MTSPGWTDGNGHDPGITLVDVLAFFVLALATASALRRWRRRRSPVR